MSNEKKTGTSVAETILEDTQALRRLMAPVARLAARAQSPEGQSPIDTLIQLQKATLDAVEQVRSGQERIIAILGQPVVERAVREMLKG